jgi:hypothetical protein
VTAALAPARLRTVAARWVAPSPLWSAAAAEAVDGDGAAMRRPALLRFASDDFMDVLAAVLAARPGDLVAHVATPQSFREVPAGAPPGWVPTAARLKLFQPLHGEFTLVAASLVCGKAGLPDHTVRAVDRQSVGFVLRRLAPGGQPAELAWAPGAGGARQWTPVPPAATDRTVAGEELFPMFPVAYEDAGRSRRLYAGLVPTSSRETFRARSSGSGPVVAPFPPSPAVEGGKADDDPRWNAFDVRVIGPLGQLQDRTPELLVPGTLRREASAFLLLDLDDLLRQHLPDVRAALHGGPAPTRPASAALLAAFRADTGVDWGQQLRSASAQWAVITGESPGSSTLQCDLHDATLLPTTLQARIRAALPGEAPTGEVPAGLDVPKLDPTGEVLYVVRCVYRRPDCAPADLVGEPSAQFAIASVLDADAPVRQVRIPLPIGTGIKDLRKYRKGVGFMVSNELRNQMNRVTDLKKALDGKLGDEEQWDLGVICQFSMPVITICALLLLLVIVFLLNIVFFWVPFFRLCLPVPLRSKS